MNLTEFKITFDGVLGNYVAEQIKESQEITNNDEINKYIQYVHDFIFSGGKRLRPYGLRLAYKGFGGTDEKSALKFGIVFELLHSMALIHDDIIDQADKRHNIPTIHKYIDGLLQKPNLHVAEGQAILVGDLVFARVYKLLYSEHDFPENLLLEARNNVHTMIKEVILGQVIDVYMTSSDAVNSELIQKKNMLKTASYTFIRPMLTGAILANADEENKNLTIDLGRDLGIAFQIRDDVFDIISGDTSKSVFSDIQEGQQTSITDYIFTSGSDEAKQLLKNCMGRRLNKEEISQLKELFSEEGGAIDHAKILVKKHSDLALETLEKMNISSDYKKHIKGLINKISDLKI